MATKITQRATLDAFGASYAGGFMETHGHARRRSKTAFLFFNADSFNRGDVNSAGQFPLEGIQLQIAAYDVVNPSDSNLMWRGDGIVTPLVVRADTATEAMRKDARLWLMTGPPVSDDSKEVVRKFVYNGGGALIVSSVLSWPGWQQTFGTFPAIEPYNLLAPLPAPEQTGWGVIYAGSGGNNPIENGLYGRAIFPSDFRVGPFGHDGGPLPVFSNDEGFLQASVTSPASAKDKTSLYNTFTFGAGRVIVSPIPIPIGDPAGGGPYGVLCRNMVAWVNKQI